MSTDIKFSKAQLSKIIQLGGFLGKSLWLKIFLSKLATKATSSVLDKFERKRSGKDVVRTRKGFSLFISNEDMDDIVESLEKSDLLIELATKTVQHEIKKKKVALLGL